MRLTLLPCIGLAAFTLAVTVPAQTVAEIGAPTVTMGTTNLDSLTPGPITLGMLQATSPGLRNITFTPNTAAAGVYNTQALHQGLGLQSGVMSIIDSLGSAPFDATNCQIDLYAPDTEIGFGIGDWIGPMVLDFYLGGVLQTTYTTSTQSGNVIYYQMTGGMFDRVDIQASTTAGNWVIADLLEVPTPTGLFPDFFATPTSGASPLAVSFTDNSLTSDPAGILAWAWDFENDGTIDSMVQNPTHTYPCGSFTVSLTVVDATGTATETKTSLITSGEITPSFTYTPMGNTVQFTDTSMPTPTSWAWDLDGDGMVDSTAQNPTFTYSGCTLTTVTLTVMNSCGVSFSTSEAIFIAPNALSTVLTGGNGTSSSTAVGNLFDIRVTNPEGINICALTVTPYSTSGAFNIDVYITPEPGGYLANANNPSAWRLVGSGTASSTLGTGFNPPTPQTVALTSPAYIPPGDYGMAVYRTTVGGGTVGIAYTNGPLGPYSDANLTIIPNPATAPGCSSTGLFSGCAFSPRVWNGTIHYGTCTGSGDPGYGPFGLGCVGSNGQVPSNTASPFPAVGVTSTITIGNLVAPEAAILVFGFDNQSAPLPFDLGTLGAPGCTVRVIPAINLLILGASGSASLNLPIPNSPSFLCNVFYTQALALDSNANLLGATISDPAQGIIGQ